MSKTHIIALIVAGGSGSRMEGSVAKQYRDLSGLSVLARAVRPFLAHQAVASCHVVIDTQHLGLFESAIAGLVERIDWIEGGPTRQASVYNGLAAIVGKQASHVLIHDGARPMVDGAIIDRCLARLLGADAPDGVVPAIAVTDSIKRAKQLGGTIDEDMVREELWQAQTPQCFRYDALWAAHRQARLAGLEGAAAYTDDAALARMAGLRIDLVAGSRDNIKITTSDDLALAASMVARTSSDEPARLMLPRVGMGYDVHRFVAGSEVILGGVRIAHHQTLAGHSDADVALHAVTDAILGAIGEGDIGRLFPDSDPRWRGADSAIFLAEAIRRLHGIQGRLVNIDLTIICQQPRIEPHRDSIRARIAGILKVSECCINVKATTTERLGFTGRGEGIAAQAAVLVLAPEPSQ